MAEQLKLNNQVCFPLYVLSKEITNLYRPFLEDLDLTYPQYLVLLVLWEEKKQTVSQLGEKLSLDSGTLTPLLKRLEQKEVIYRKRATTDERIVEISLTEKGKKLKRKAADIPQKLNEKINLSEEEKEVLKQIISKLIKIQQ